MGNTDSICHQRWNAIKEHKPLREIEELPDGSMVVNGVVLSPNVLYELRRLGIALFSYNAGELQTAVQACIIDRTLIDDPDGINFFDRTSLTPSESQEDDECDIPRNPFHLHAAHLHHRDDHDEHYSPYH